MTPKPPRWPLVLLGLMTAFTFGGPLAIGHVLRGGPTPDWPPDRPVEWATLVGVSAMVGLLMMACLSLGYLNRKAMTRGPAATGPEEPGVEP